MKKIFLSSLIVLFGISVSGQQIIKQDYLKKSKTQKTMAWILASGGGALVFGGIISDGTNVSYYPGEEVGTALMACGAVAITGGIILFSASKKNEKKANEMAVAINMKLESAEIYRHEVALKKYYPAVSLKFNLR